VRKTRVFGSLGELQGDGLNNITVHNFVTDATQVRGCPPRPHNRAVVCRTLHWQWMVSGHVLTLSPVSALSVWNRPSPWRTRQTGAACAGMVAPTTFSCAPS
jgi:hypothetical protein